jgi:hypothetical protein
MRLNDDLIELEMEKIEAIIDKIEKDPEDREVKLAEITLWKRYERRLWAVEEPVWESLQREICLLLWV